MVPLVTNGLMLLLNIVVINLAVGNVESVCDCGFLKTGPRPDRRARGTIPKSSRPGRESPEHKE
jgi:hypothetical protein